MNQQMSLIPKFTVNRQLKTERHLRNVCYDLYSN